MHPPIPYTSRGVSRYTTGSRPDSLAEVLERVLDRGVVIAGDIVVHVLDIELLTLKLRLIIASVDTAKELGLDWWTRDPFLSARARDRELETENRELRDRIEALERRLDAGKPEPGAGAGEAEPGAGR